VTLYYLKNSHNIKKYYHYWKNTHTYITCMQSISYYAKNITLKRTPKNSFAWILTYFQDWSPSKIYLFITLLPLIILIHVLFYITNKVHSSFSMIIYVWDPYKYHIIRIWEGGYKIPRLLWMKGGDILKILNKITH